ncbi:MAG: MBL fold metallo-hydrolase [Gammaproteobacteria bacterium]|jgi:metallo-beta-lactamase family protein
MKLEFYGAAGEVTGSCHVITVAGKKILLDCGLIQGGRKQTARNREPWPFEPASIDAVVLSHAHIDHSGRLPLLIRDGFDGPVHTQRATRDLCRIMLKDAGFLAEKEAESENRKRQRKGLRPVRPLYTMDDAKAAMPRFKGIGYDERKRILPGVQIRFRDAGHILGSGVVELWLREGGLERKLVFSGDIGHRGAPILRDPSTIADADLVLMESTYGDRQHRSREETIDELAGIFREASHDHGNILIPAFAVGRSQELLYLLSQHQDDWGLENWRVFLDSPMAIQATETYARYTHLHDEEASRLWRMRDNGRSLLPHFQISRTAKQSMALNRVHQGAIIMAGSGMCEGGRIKHHLKNNIWRKGCHVIIVGYQAEGTLGRRLVDGAQRIRLWGETVKVSARIHTVGGLSAHADQDGLLSWYQGFEQRPLVFLVHGESRAQEALARRMRDELQVDVGIARRGQVLDLADLRSVRRAAA